MSNWANHVCWLLTGYHGCLFRGGNWRSPGELLHFFSSCTQHFHSQSYFFTFEQKILAKPRRQDEGLKCCDSIGTIRRSKGESKELLN